MYMYEYMPSIDLLLNLLLIGVVSDKLLSFNSEDYIDVFLF